MINKIPIDDYVDINIEKVELCSVCQSLNRIPCPHKRVEFRRRDRMDTIAEALNEIIDHLNETH